ncbi:MAG: TetR/AcrR family transcriptional regulator [Natronospirillum sp.]|uniref:TetR/AcrR family transcriptional regulator n=1 Tax=Natronospirillum sp. TaxID=2812955 RepID=UPI0025D67DFA|nr:TetR/AcrR family transcriptional regulator [Natronospirillum sp.]MCH8551234.1 TetR/AcrR family transcriptional regulator [Natronospirillum sp.]
MTANEQGAGETAIQGPRKPKTARGKKTRAKILRAAEECFGTLGYHQAGITDITRYAGVALGSFYSYFSGKEDAMRELVREMGHNLRAHLAQNVAGATDRVDAEVRGLRAFLEYIRDHPWMYRILQEVQFVDEAVYREYYDTFSEHYARLLSEATQAGELRPGNNQVRNWALMGMGHFLGMRFALWDEDVPMDEIIKTMDDLLRHGLARSDQ